MSVKLSFVSKRPEDDDNEDDENQSGDDNDDEVDEEVDEDEEYKNQSDEEDEDVEEDVDDDSSLENGDDNDDNDENDENDAPDEDDIQDDDYSGLAAGGDDDQVFDTTQKRKVTTRKKVLKKKLFPFLQKKKRKTVEDDRETPEYFALDIRDKSVTYLNTLFSVSDKKISNLERNIYNAAVRSCGDEISSTDSHEFKTLYMNILKYVSGASVNLTTTDIIKELKCDNHGWKSSVFQEAIKTEQAEMEKIKNPATLSEYPDHKCYKCGGIRHFRRLMQMRGGDEGQSALFWCGNKACGANWRING